MDICNCYSEIIMKMCKIVQTILFGYCLFCWHIDTEYPYLCVHVGCSYLLVYSYVLKLRHSKLSAGCSFHHFSQNLLMISRLQTHVKHQEILKKSRTFLSLLDTSAEMLFLKFTSRTIQLQYVGWSEASARFPVVFFLSLIFKTTRRRLPIALRPLLRRPLITVGK
jgi:hypothetical protein